MIDGIDEKIIPSTNEKIIQKQKDELAWITGLLVSAQKKGWHGTITIPVKNGMFQPVGIEQTFMPPKDHD